MLDPRKSSEFADRVTALLENVVVGLEGFLEGRVFEADDRKAVTLITAWETTYVGQGALESASPGLLAPYSSRAEPGLKIGDIPPRYARAATPFAICGAAAHALKIGDISSLFWVPPARAQKTFTPLRCAITGE